MSAYPVDLTMLLREGIAAYPSHGRPILGLSRVMKHSDFAGKGRFNPYDGAEVSFEVTQWLLGDQAGTHMDAPLHADPDSSYSIDTLPLMYAWGPAVWIDCSADASGDGISVAHLEAALRRSAAELVPGDILLLRTGASDAAVSDPGGYVFRTWGLTKEAAEWVRQQGVKTFGIDCVTIESAGTVAQASVHTNFLRPAALGLEPADVIAVIENLTGLGKIPDHRFTFAGFPLPLAGAAGSPLRAVALPQ
jgi:arylformamidase